MSTLETALVETLVLKLEATQETAHKATLEATLKTTLVEFGLVWHNRIDVEITLTYVG